MCKQDIFAHLQTPVLLLIYFCSALTVVVFNYNINAGFDIQIINYQVKTQLHVHSSGLKQMLLVCISMLIQFILRWQDLKNKQYAIIFCNHFST